MYVYFALLLTIDVMWLAALSSSCHDFIAIIDYNLGPLAKVNPTNATHSHLCPFQGILSQQQKVG